MTDRKFTLLKQSNPLCGICSSPRAR